jgi:transposase
MIADFIIRSSRNFGIGGSQGNLESRLLDTFLELCQQRGYLRTRGRQRTDSTHVLGAVKGLNSLELVGETVRHALNVLATVVPEWLKQQVKPEWFDRYGQRMEDYRLPKDKSEREALSTTIGEDGFLLLACVQQAKEMEWRREASGNPNLVRGLEATISL